MPSFGSVITKKRKSSFAFDIAEVKFLQLAQIISNTGIQNLQQALGQNEADVLEKHQKKH